MNLSSAVLDCDLVFLALHGGSGENGQIQALLELAQIPFTGSGSTASGLAMDKELSKRVAGSAGILTPDWLTGSVSASEVEDRLGWPVVVKPDAEGSSVGLSIVGNPDGLPAAIQEAAAYGQVIIERYITGREFTVSVLGDSALPVGEIVKPDGQVFDYASKYQKEGWMRSFRPEYLQAWLNGSRRGPRPFTEFSNCVVTAAVTSLWMKKNRSGSWRLTLCPA